MVPERTDTDEFKAQAAEFAAKLGDQKRVLVTTHISPDGDAVASMLSASEILRQLASEAICCLPDRVPRRYDFLPGADYIIETADLNDKDWDRILVVDSGNLSRIGDLANRISPETPLVNVDHHADNSRFGDLNVVYPEAASTTEILFDLIQTLHLSIPDNLATLIYAGLFTDTGGFRFSNTTERTFSIAARMVRHGANPNDIAEAVYASNSPTSMRLLGKALSSLELTEDGCLATMTVEQDNSAEEMEDLADYGLAIKGVRAAALFRLEGESVRVSLRGRGAVNVSRVARRFGGGGHAKAAGFTVKGNYDKLRSQVIAALNEEIGR